MSITLTLPWPDPRLGPNARGHWAEVARLKKRQRGSWAWTATTQGIHALRSSHTPAQIAKATLRITFHPPTLRAYDLDNRVASIKAGLDGLADALQCDDKGWQLAVMMGPARPKNGVVVVEIEVSDGQAV